MKTLLYATDCRPETTNALKYAHRLSKVLNAQLHVLHVYDLYPFTTTTVRSRGVLERNFSIEQDAILKKYCKEHLQHEANIQKPHFHTINNSSITEVILNTAQKIDADLVIVGVKSSNLSRGFFAGNIANELMKNLECPLLIVPEEFQFHGLSTLLYATDFETSDIHAIVSLVDFAQPYGALIKIIHIQRKMEYDVEKNLESFKIAVGKKVSYPEIVFSIKRAEDLESGIHQSINQEMPEMLVMLERQHNTFWNRLFHKDTVMTMEDEISIPLLVFNQKSVEAKLDEQPNHNLFKTFV